MERDDRAAFEALVREGLTVEFSGWDFSVMTGRWRWLEERPPWDYRQVVREKMQGSEAMLDMGTGGGEFLSSLAPLPAHTRATESYRPNVPLARSRLEPLGVKVVELDSDARLPFADGEFDLIINRHESYDLAEVRRILRQGGRFITQQVGGRDNLRLNELLSGPLPDDFADWHVESEARAMERAGLTVVRREEAFPLSRFSDIGAVVFYLRVIPWQIPGYDVESYKDALYALHQRMMAEGPLVVTSHRFLIEGLVG